MRSGWSVAVLILALLAPGWTGFAAADPHGCTDHACYCRKAPEAPKPRARASCHEAAPQAAPVDDGCRIRGACRHDVPQLSALRPFTLEPSTATSPIAAAERVAAAQPMPVVPGFDRLDPRPPRSHS